jgi:hypothetical protein
MRMPLLAGTAFLLAACSDATEVAEERLERSAETSVAVAGAVPAALGLTEAQLLDADLVGPDGKELGDIAKVVRGADNKVERLLVEIDGTNPDRYVHVPITGLKTMVRGDDTDLQTTMNKTDLMSLPEIRLPAP